MPAFKFELEDKSGDLELLELNDELVGWDTNKPTLTRDDVYHGVIRSFTVDVTFIREGYEYLKEIYERTDGTGGILAECYIYVYEYNNSTHEFVLQDVGTIDFTSWDIGGRYGKGVTLTITDTAYAEKIRGREDTEINYNDSTDLDDVNMSDPVYIEQTVFGAEIISKGTVTVEDDGEISFKIADSVPLGSFYIPPISYDGDIEGIQSVVARYLNDTTGFYDEDTDAFLIVAEDGDIVIDGVLKFDMFVDNSSGLDSTSYVKLRKVSTDDEGVVTGEDLAIWESSGSGQYTGIELDISGTYAVNEGDSFYISARNGGDTAYDNNGTLTMDEATFSIKTSTKDEATISKAALLFDCFNRSIEAMTGVPDSLTSAILADGGEFHDYSIQNGLLLRNYTVAEAGMSWKFSDLFDAMNKIFNIGLAINSDNTCEIKKRSDFYQQGVVHTVEASEIESNSFSKVVNTDYFYSDVEVGYSKAAYDEDSGLEEYNNESYFSTIISNIANTLDLVSDIRGDIYGIEYCRREQYDADSSSDTSYDDDLFILNVVKNGDDWQQLTDEDFDVITGIDDITTPGNLNITPARNLRRHGWLLATGLQKYQSEKVKFTTADFESDLSTTNTKGLAVTESESVTYEQLDTPILTGHSIKFTAKLSMSNYAKIKASPYQLIKVWNPIDKEYNYGWLQEVSMESVDKSTTWELIEAVEAIEEVNSWTWNDGDPISWNDGGDILTND